MSIKILSEIQNKVKAPKSNINKFGGYSYRSAEDIMEAVKPVLLEYEAVITMNEEIVMVGERYYIRASATFYCDGFTCSSIAYARESLSRKGMDDAQLTGATSSYARKYALAGLLLLDDTKDSDATNQHGKSEIPNQSRIQKPNQGELNDLKGYADKLGKDTESKTYKDWVKKASRQQVVELIAKYKAEVENE